MFYKLSRSSDAMILELEGECTLECAKELKAALLEGLETGQKLLVDLRKVTQVDTSCLQLLCSARGSSAKLGKQVLFGANPSEELMSFAKDTGYLHALGFDGAAGAFTQKGIQ